MKHLGDITKISGHTAPIVDCIIGGSPCQDLSVAGKRAGLDGERSGLFMEQLRVIKEMRSEDEQNGRAGVDIRPRYMVWENVPGAFSSNKGEDFRIVLEETAKVTDKDAVIPMPDKGKWTSCGCILGDGWSIAWRVLDAQFWGVPQRRCRIALVADFGGQSAPEILFVRKGLSGNTDESESKRKETATDASRGFGADDSIGFDGYNGELTGNKMSTLGVNCGMSTGRNGAIQRAYRTRYIVRRLTPLECERLQGYPDGWTQIGEVVGYDRQIDEITGEEYVQAIYEYIDDNGKKRKTSDASRYKALGNSIALPPWKWVLKRLCACYERDATMASLFDGIGGFPYLWEQLNGKGTCLWASEIEEFPIAVTKVRIGE